MYSALKTLRREPLNRKTTVGLLLIFVIYGRIFLKNLVIVMYEQNMIAELLENHIPFNSQHLGPPFCGGAVILLCAG